MDLKRNLTRQRMAQALREGKKKGSAYEVLRFLARSDAPRTMDAITSHLHTIGYGGKTYYDATNALVETGFAQSCKNQIPETWCVTPLGLRFANGK